MGSTPRVENPASILAPDGPGAGTIWDAFAEVEEAEPGNQSFCQPNTSEPRQ